MRGWLAVLCIGSFGAGLALALPACGGATAGTVAGGDGGPSSSSSGGGGGGTGSGGGTSGSGGSGGTGSSSGGTSSLDASLPPSLPPCDPPSDPGKAALCITVTPEVIAFTSDPGFDGKGWLVAEVFDTAQPDAPDGGEAPTLAAQAIGEPDAGTVDLSQPLPVIRFDGLPSTVYPRVVFEDDPGASGSLGPGAWLAGYDLSAGLGGEAPLVAEPLPAGTGTAVAMKLTALRELVVTMTRSVAPAGNGEGEATFIATPAQTASSTMPLFGAGQAPCARVDGSNQATVRGFVVGAGPYFVGGVLDDFGTGDGGIGLPPGALTSLQESATGSLVLPAADQLAYASDTYRITQTIALGTVIPGAPATDSVTCP